MNDKILSRLRASLVGLLFLISIPAHALPQYRSLDIHALLSNAKDSHAEAINTQGHISGSFTTTDQKNKIFIYRPELGMEEIDTVGNENAGISDMNDSDQFVGYWGGEYNTNTGYFIYRSGWVDPAPLVSVKRINNSGDVLGIISHTRGALSQSPAILKQDGNVVNLLASAIDCDQAVSGNCDADNRFDFDYWTSVSVLDMNDSGQVLFYTSKRLDTPQKHFHVYLYTPGKGIKLIRSHKLSWRYLSRTSGAINNTGVIAISYVSGRRSQRTFIYSTDGTEQTPTTIFNQQGRKRSLNARYLNDSNVLGSKYDITFSLTDLAQRSKTKDLLASLFGNVPSYSLYISVYDINNANVLAGDHTIDSTTKATAFYPATSGHQNITIDGIFSDWSSAQSFSDSTTDGATVNWETVWTHNDENNVSFSYKNTTNIIPENLYLWNIYLDTDHNSATGYNFTLLGADTLLQGKNLYQYTGSGTNWSWNYVGDASFAVQGARAELSIQKSIVGMPANTRNYRALFYGTNIDGSNLDYLLIDQNGTGGSVIMEEITVPGA
jgi:hypothetical protein